MESQVNELLDGAASGSFVLPSAEHPNAVSLIRAIAGICGVPDYNADSTAKRIRQRIGEPEHLVFIVADGFGVNFVQDLGDESPLKQGIAFEGHAAFPSSTGPNMYSFAWGEWPGRHGILGWYVHLPELNERITPFPWVRTKDLRDLSELGISGSDVYRGVPQVPRFTRDSAILIPDEFANSVASRAMHGTGLIRGYPNLSTGIDLILSRVRNATKPTFTHLFWPKIDSAAHEFGTAHENTIRQVELLDLEFSRLRQALPENAVVVLTADHGHLDFGEHGRIEVPIGDPLRDLLVDSPSGDERSLMFHVLPGIEHEFANAFQRRFSDDFILLTADEVVEQQLLGPEGLSDHARQRLGDFMVVSKNHSGLVFRDLPSTSGFVLQSQHGGLSRDEMLVPIVIA